MKKQFLVTKKLLVSRLFLAFQLLKSVSRFACTKPVSQIQEVFEQCSWAHGILGCPAQGQELALVVLLGRLQLSRFYDSV